MDPFEQSADMRLLELQRKALGKEAPPRSAWSATATDMHEGIPLEEPAAPNLSGARLLVDLVANPKAKLVPGAVVTLSLSVQNAGDQSARDVRVCVPIPGETKYREGSMQIDGREVSGSYADAFFGEGYLIQQLAAGQRAAFIWKISIERGTSSLVLAPRVLSANAAVVGSASLLLTRGAMQKSATVPQEYLPKPPEIERPFYELDPHEEATLDAEFGAAPNEIAAAPLFVMPDVVAQEPEPESEPEPKSEPEPEQEPEPERITPSTEPAVAAAPLPEPPRLYCTFDATSLALVKKLFMAESFGQVPHYILQNSLACSLDSQGRDIGLRAHFSQQAGLLSRALLMHKLGKATNVADFCAGKTGLDLPSAPEVPPAQPPTRLRMALGAADVEFCAPVEGRNQLESFIRLRQLAVTLQARHAEIPDAAASAALDALLERYATAARAAINRTFIRAKLDRNFDPFGAADAATDALARDLIAALEGAVTA